MALVTFLVEDSKTIRDSLVPALEEMTGARVVGASDAIQLAGSALQLRHRAAARD